MGRRARTKPRKEGLTEAEVTREVIDALKLYGLRPERQNVGGLKAPGGRYVAFGSPGDADWRVPLGPIGDPRTMYLELKREGWRPGRARGRERERFARQADKLRRANADGGVGLWLDSAEPVPRIIEVLRRGGRVEVDAAGWCYLVTDDDEGEGGVR